MDSDTAKYLRKNQEEYPDVYDSMKWISPEEIDAANLARKKILDDIFDHFEAERAFSDTKPYTYSLSPGCVFCGQGAWSCLFINGVCNANCFYCPSAQKDNSPPMTHSLIFESPEQYVQYVNHFQIKAVSFSGGEPFLSFGRVMNYLKALRSGADHPVYIWMYTNGILGNIDKFKALRDAGLDEIRFDLSADDYRLGTLQKAVDIIPRVTVEIPAIPEDLSKTKPMLNSLYDIGLSYLNLHQIRCTSFNRKHLSERGYTFIHGPKVTVLETELAALKLMRHALQNKIKLPINYCSFTYRHQFQGAGARKRYAPFIKKNWEDITATGHIRQLKIVGKEADIEKIALAIGEKNADPGLYSMTPKKDGLFLSAKLLPLINLKGTRLNAAYYTAALKPALSYRFPFTSIHLKHGKSIVIEKQPADSPAIFQEENEIDDFRSFLNNPIPLQNNHKSDAMSRALLFERIRPGLAPYI